MFALLSKYYLSSFGIIAIAILYLYFNKKRNYWKIRNVPHRPTTLFFGNFLDFILRPEYPGVYFKNLYKEFEGPYIGFLAFTNPVLIVKDLDIIKRILIKDFNSFRDRLPIADSKIDPFFSKSLFGMKGEYWRLIRTKLTPVFTSGKIKLMIPLMNECGDNLVKYIEKTVGDSVEMKSTMDRYTTDVISTCAFGVNANSFASVDSDFYAMSRKVFPFTFSHYLKVITYFLVPACVKLFKYRFVPSVPAEFFRNAFIEIIKKREESKFVRNDYVDIIINLKNQSEDSEYIETLIVNTVEFFSAGQETTSRLISFTIHELCVHTDMQERLRNEIEKCIAKHSGLTYEAIQDMEYLDMVVSESLRKYIAIPFLQRTCNKDYTIPETGLKIEEGTIVMLLPVGSQADPKYFPNPDIFDPERFNSENKKNIMPYSFMPFGEGPRNCIGERFGLLSGKLGIIHLVRNFQVHRNSYTNEPIVFSPTALANPNGGIQVTFTKL